MIDTKYKIKDVPFKYLRVGMTFHSFKDGALCRITKLLNDLEDRYESINYISSGKKEDNLFHFDFHNYLSQHSCLFIDTLIDLEF